MLFQIVPLLSGVLSCQDIIRQGWQNRDDGCQGRLFFEVHPGHVAC